MSALDSGGLIVIDPDKSIAFNVEYVLANSRMNNLAIINTHALVLEYEGIKSIVKNPDYLKIFYGCDEEEYKKMISRFTVAGEVFYLGKRLSIPEAIICYWKNKGFQEYVSAPMSNRHDLESS